MLIRTVIQAVRVHVADYHHFIFIKKAVPDIEQGSRCRFADNHAAHIRILQIASDVCAVVVQKRNLAVQRCSRSLGCDRNIFTALRKAERRVAERLNLFAAGIRQSHDLINNRLGQIHIVDRGNACRIREGVRDSVGAVIRDEHAVR